jgi:hypothetical protein
MPMMFIQGRGRIRAGHTGLVLETLFASYGAVDAGTRRRVKRRYEFLLKREEFGDGLALLSLPR